jgi:hypothetical protein
MQEIGVNRSVSVARMQRALAAWQRVSEAMRMESQRRASTPRHDRDACSVCRRGIPGRCVFVDAMIVAEDDLEILADGFDLMSQFWAEIDGASEAGSARRSGRPGLLDLVEPGEEFPESEASTASRDVPPRR